jgi:plasmid stability protein
MWEDGVSRKQKAMNQILIRNLEDEIVQRLKQIAWQEGRPPEEMARHLLVDAIRTRAARRTLHEFEAHG